MGMETLGATNKHKTFENVNILFTMIARITTHEKQEPHFFSKRLEANLRD